MQNHYDVLGVTPDATPEQIKAAYRRQAKKLHPDHSGQESGPFRAVQEAYEVLSNPAWRRAYDAHLARNGRPDRRVPPPESPAADPPDSWVDPLFSRPRGGWDWPDEPAGAPWPERSGWDWPDEMAGDPWPGRSGPKVYQAAPGESTIEVDLSPAEARRGGQVRVRLPIQVTCPVCQGSGVAEALVCAPCGGAGELTTEYYVQVPFPAGLAGSHTSRVPLDQLGLPDTYITVRFSV